MKQAKIFLIYSIILLSIAIYSNIAVAISIKTNRIIFNENKQQEIVTVKNNTNVEQSYIVTWLHYKMQNDKNGKLKLLSKYEQIKGINWADDMIRVEPDKFTIPPHSQKQIKLSVISYPPPKTGEYRTHLQIKTITETNANASHAAIANAGIVTPIFIHHGNLTAKAEIKDTKINKFDNKYLIDFVLARQGNISVYGNINIFCVGKVIAEVNGIAVYTEVNQKNISIKIPNKLPPNCNELEIKYISLPSDNIFKGQIITQNKIKIPDN